MKLSELSVRRPVLITMAYVLILIVAALFLPSLSTSLYPTVDLPVIGIIVKLDTSTEPEQVELQIAKELENAVSSVDDLKKITSTSSSTNCMVVLEFEFGTDLDEAQNDVDDAIAMTTSDFPDWVESTTTLQFDVSQNSTFMVLVLSGPGTNSDKYNYADNTLSPMFERINGVSQVSITGASDDVYEVQVDPIKLESYNITLAQVSSALASTNVQSSGGTVTQNGLDYQISVDERYKDLNSISNTVITTLDGVDIHISEVANVVITSEDDSNLSYLDGKPVITLRLSNDSDTNATDIAKEVYKRLPEIRASLPKGYDLNVQRDETTMISDTMDEVTTSAIEGVILAALVIFIFLRNLKATFIISLSMPISILITLAIMSIADISINSMSMAGLILGIGMIVDASVIILENTFKYREKGYGTVTSAIFGSYNMSNAIIASTLTTICVFIPLIIYKNQLEMIGNMFQDLIYTVCISLISSLFVAFTLVPALTGSILRVNTRTQKPLKNRFLRWIDNGMAKFEKKMENAYAGVLNYLLSHRLLFIVFLVLMLAFSFIKFSGVGMSLTPTMTTDDSVGISLTLPSGTDKEVTKNELFSVYEKLLDTLPQEAYTSVSIDVGDMMGMGSSSENEGSIEIDMPDIEDQTYDTSEIKDLVRPLLKGNPDASWTFNEGRGPGSDSAVDVAVSSASSEDALDTVNQIKAIIDTYVPEATNTATDLSNGSPKVTVVVDKEKASSLGVSVSDVASLLYYALSGSTASTITAVSSDNTYDLDVTISDDAITDVDAVGSLLVSSKNGNIRLDSFCTMSESTSPMTITREDKQRVNHVTMDAAGNYTSSDVQDAVNEALDEHLLLPDGVTVSQEGQMTDFADYAPTLVIIVLLALVLVFAVMAAQFESLIDPFIVFATIPLLLIGVIFIHLWMHQAFSLFSIVGIIALIGTVVNNGIVMVDSINQLVRKKVPVREACLTSARTRLRPILMTTLTDIIGMIPLAFFPGDGAEMMQPIALTFVGGIVTGSFLTLLLSPVLYSIFNKRREKKYQDPHALINEISTFDTEYPNEKNYPV